MRKKIILILTFLSVNFFTNAQFGGVLDKAKKKAEEKGGEGEKKEGEEEAPAVTL